MTKKTLPPACQFEHGDPPGKQLFGIYNQGGPEEKRGITWDGREVPGWEGITDQVREKWTHLANTTGFDGRTMFDEATRIKEALTPSTLPALNGGHAWLLKLLYSHFRTDGFSFNVEKCSFSGNGKGIKTEKEIDNVRRWFTECVDHGAIALYAIPDPGVDPIWCVRSLPNMTAGVLTLDENATLESLISEFVDIIPISELETSACLVVKGAGIPKGFGKQMYTALTKRGAPENMLIIELPPNIHLSTLNEKQMRGNGWVRAQNKPRLWRPGDPTSN